MTYCEGVSSHHKTLRITQNPIDPRNIRKRWGCQDEGGESRQKIERVRKKYRKQASVVEETIVGDPFPPLSLLFTIKGREST